MEARTATAAIQKTQVGKISLFSAGHLVNDLYMNQIQVLIPFWVLAGLSVSEGGFLVAAFTVTSSLVQPLFGMVVVDDIIDDLLGKRRTT